MKVRNWREKCKDRRLEQNRKAGQNPSRVVAPIEEEDLKCSVCTRQNKANISEGG
jgi:hypothetical protein